MKRKYKHLALVPARGGSTGIRDKNLQKIGELSLVKLAWNYCLEADFFDYICLSTDSEKISQEIFPQFDLDSTAPHTLSFVSEKMIIHHRHESLSNSSSSVYELISEISKLKEIKFDFLWLVQPTTPFRNQFEFEEIKQIIEINHDLTSIISVKDVSSNHPDRMFKIQNLYLKHIYDQDGDVSKPRQLLPTVYIKDGGYYVFKYELIQNNIYLGDRILPYIRSYESNVNIDSSEELNYARYIYSVTQNDK
jgi:CMP-N-acetylneuraminic acid synthetase